MFEKDLQLAPRLERLEGRPAHVPEPQQNGPGAKNQQTGPGHQDGVGLCPREEGSLGKITQCLGTSNVWPCHSSI